MLMQLTRVGAVSLVAVAASLVMAAVPGPIAEPVRLLVVANCKCTPTLVLTPKTGDTALCNCIAVTSLSSGMANKPTCNAIEGCTAHVACDPAPGSVSVSAVRPRPDSCTCSGLISVSLNGTPFGSFSTGSGGLTMTVGGDSTPCAALVLEEGTGDTIELKCGTTVCSFQVKDRCNPCGGQ